MGQIDDLLKSYGLEWTTNLYGNTTNDQYVRLEIQYRLDVGECDGKTSSKNANTIMKKLLGIYGVNNFLKIENKEKFFDKAEATNLEQKFVDFLLKEFISIRIDLNNKRGHWGVYSSKFRMKDIEVQNKKIITDVMGKSSFEFSKEEKMKIMFNPKETDVVIEEKINNYIQKIVQEVRKQILVHKDLYNEMNQIIEKMLEKEIKLREVTKEMFSNI